LRFAVLIVGTVIVHIKYCFRRWSLQFAPASYCCHTLQQQLHPRWHPTSVHFPYIYLDPIEAPSFALIPIWHSRWCVPDWSALFDKALTHDDLYSLVTAIGLLETSVL
jgi:hypothetical protein